MTCKDEADIVGASIGHLFTEGVDEVYVAHGPSSDDTLTILDDFERVRIYNAPEPIHRQVYWASRLAADAGEAGADWIIPVDADEFWCPKSGGTIRDALATQPPDVTTLCATMWHYRNWNVRNAEPKPLPKTAFRWRPNAHIELGAHSVLLPGVTDPGKWDVLEVREIQFRGFEHYCAKVASQIAGIDPALGSGEALHYRNLAGKTKDELLIEWRAACKKPTTVDPIPSSLCPPTAL